jgi:hypothetical protein
MGILVCPGQVYASRGLRSRSVILSGDFAFRTLGQPRQESMRVPGVDFRSVQLLVPMALIFRGGVLRRRFA